MPEFLRIFIDLFIVLASIMGIVVAVQSQKFLERPILRIRLMLLFFVAFAMCLTGIVPFVLVELSLEPTMIWRITSALALVVNTGVLLFVWRLRREDKADPDIGSRFNYVVSLVVILFSIWLSLNALGTFGTPSAVPLGFWFLAMFIIEAAGFTRAAMIRPRPSFD